MEVDHFNPNKKAEPIQQYSNLFLSSRHCNGAKRDRWPTGRDREAGIRFLNCCEEADYGLHIFEDPDDHTLVGVTPAGKYHVRNCDLNAPHLVLERDRRARLWALLESQRITIKKDLPSMLQHLEVLKDEVEKMIPKIEYLSGDALEKHRVRKKALAALMN